MAAEFITGQCRFDSSPLSGEALWARRAKTQALVRPVGFCAVGLADLGPQSARSGRVTAVRVGADEVPDGSARQRRALRLGDGNGRQRRCGNLDGPIGGVAPHLGAGSPMGSLEPRLLIATARRLKVSCKSCACSSGGASEGISSASPGLTLPSGTMACKTRLHRSPRMPRHPKLLPLFLASGFAQPWPETDGPGRTLCLRDGGSCARTTPLRARPREVYEVYAKG